jgi:hypothetical protein
METRLHSQEPGRMKVLWNNLQQPWTITKLLGLACLLIGLAGLIEGRIPYLPFPGLAEFHQSLSPALFGAGIAVLLIGWGIERLAALVIQEEKTGSFSKWAAGNAFAVEAADAARRKWLFDGTLAGAQPGQDQPDGAT